MGIYRYLLALSVLLAHVGGLGWIPPRVAVYSFYGVSGFLIFRVLDEVYMNNSYGLIKFYINRFLRLAPLFIVLLLLSYLISHYRQGAPHEIGNNESVAYINSLVYTEPLKSLKLDLTFLFYPDAFIREGIPYFGFDIVRAMRQSWTIGIEITFYLLAPFLIFFYRRSVKAIYIIFLIALIIFIYYGIKTSNFENYNYKNFVTSFYAFLAGVVIYHLTKTIKFRFQYHQTIPLVLFWFYLLWFWSTKQHFQIREITNLSAVLVLIFFTIPVVAIICFTEVPEKFSAMDRWFGDMSYGIYLNHFLVASIMLTFDETIARATNYERIFGIPNRTLFGLHAVIFSTIFAHFTYRLVEQPVEALRKKIRL